jgi:hypothetical protein
MNEWKQMFEMCCLAIALIRQGPCQTTTEVTLTSVGSDLLISRRRQSPRWLFGTALSPHLLVEKDWLARRMVQCFLRNSGSNNVCFFPVRLQGRSGGARLPITTAPWV